MTLISAVAAAASNKTFSDIATDPAFWESLGSGSRDEYLQSNYGLSMKDLLDGLIDAFLTGEMRSLGCSIEDIKRKTQSASAIPSPIVLDLDGDGVETISVTNGAWFDHAADGFAERTGWAGSDDGLVVRDLDGNGTIDSGRELFGSETLLPSGTKAANGFEALKALDANTDGVIDAQDVAFAELRIWKDTNANGRTEAGELLTLAEAGVSSFNVAYANSSHTDAQGNAHRQVGSYTTTSGETRTATDIWVQTNTTQSLPTDWVDVSEDIAALPDAQGYGLVRDVHQAMAMDASGDLKALVDAFIHATTRQDRDYLVTQLIYHWTGVQDIDPASRASRLIYGNAIGDARKLEALEEFISQEWVGVWCWGTRDPNPHGRAAPVLLQAWDELKALIYGQLMAQAHLQGLFQPKTLRARLLIAAIANSSEARTTGCSGAIGTTTAYYCNAIGDRGKYISQRMAAIDSWPTHRILNLKIKKDQQPSSTFPERKN